MLATTHAYDSLGQLVSTVADYEPTVEYAYDTIGTLGLLGDTGEIALLSRFSSDPRYSAAAEASR